MCYRLLFKSLQLKYLLFYIYVIFLFVDKNQKESVVQIFLFSVLKFW